MATLTAREAFQAPVADRRGGDAPSLWSRLVTAMIESRRVRVERELQRYRDVLAESRIGRDAAEGIGIAQAADRLPFVE